MPFDKQWERFLDLTNEATVVAESIGDYTLAELAYDAVQGAAVRLGLSQDRILALRQVVRKRVEELPPITKLSQQATPRDTKAPAPPKTKSSRPQSRAASTRRSN
jgi:hypothetical protein